MGEVGKSDLDWWFDLAPTLKWLFARSMPRWPHHYVLAGKTPGFGWDDLDRVLLVIRHYGQPSKFFSRTNLELVSPDGGRKYWCQIELPIDAYKPILVNSAATDQVTGPQVNFDQAFLSEVALPLGRLA